jgi:hypothetical protein
MQEISARQLRMRAEEARTMADQMKYGPARRTMWGLAVSYDVLARRAEEREARERPARVTNRNNRAA